MTKLPYGWATAAVLQFAVTYGFALFILLFM